MVAIMASGADPVREALAELRRRLGQRFGDRLLGMTLYGSHARGEARSDSDVDVLVVVRDLTGQERTRVYEIGADVSMERRIALAPLAVSPAELEELRRLERLLWQDIAREGINL
jgi:uncharacterized protein